MRDRIEAFLRELEVRASINTVDAYRNDLGLFEEFAAERAGGTAPAAAAIGRGAIEAHVEWLGGRGYAPSTIARKAAAVKSFCGFLAEAGDLDANPACEIPPPRAPKTEPDVLCADDVAALLRQPLAGGGGPAALRDAAMLGLLCATGVSVSELISLNLEDLHPLPRPESVRCAGRGGRERTIPLDAAAHAAERYLDEGRPRLIGNGWQDALFVNQSGGRLTRQGFWAILKGHAERAGIGARVTPHVLRHTFAVEALRGGMPIADVQRRLGLGKGAMQIYARIAAGQS